MSSKRTPYKYTQKKLLQCAKSLTEAINSRLKQKNPAPFFLMEWALREDFDPSRFTIYIEKNEEFKKAYLKAKIYQELFLFKGGLDGSLHAGLVIFGLRCNHGWDPNKPDDAESGKRSMLEKLVNFVRNGKKEEK